MKKSDQLLINKKNKEILKELKIKKLEKKLFLIINLSFEIKDY